MACSSTDAVALPSSRPVVAAAPGPGTLAGSAAFTELPHQGDCFFVFFMLGVWIRHSLNVLVVVGPSFVRFLSCGLEFGL